jgi:tartrate-resistant acid phosphatase type 5
VDTTAVFQGDAAFQAGWLKDQLAASNAVWKVVAGHHPMRSNGPHGNAGAYEGWRWVPWMSGGSLATFFEDAVCGQADLYLAGHDHTRQVLAYCGVTLVVAGTGASATRVVDRGNPVDFADAERGFTLFRLGADRGEVQLYGETGSLDGTFQLAVPSGRAQNAPEGPP